MFTPSHKDLDLSPKPANNSELPIENPFEPPQVLDKTSFPIASSANPIVGQRIQFFTYHFIKQHFVLLRRSDWELLIKVFEELETLQVAIGRWFMSAQPMQIAQPFTSKGQEWVILPTNAWQRFIQQIEDCANAFSYGLNHLQLEQIESFDRFSDLSLSDVIADSLCVDSPIEKSSPDRRVFIPKSASTDGGIAENFDHSFDHSFTDRKGSSSSPIARPG